MPRSDDPVCSTIDYQGWLSGDISLVVDKGHVYITYSNGSTSLPINVLKQVANKLEDLNL